MEKILKKYTTIPQHLYVNRSADIQLKRIIEEMQRPGYVLVARQMGKTNLLFNAKRTLENENRLFAYVDLSNLYKNERDCYRNIINSIIEPNLNIFDSIESDIERIRIKELPPHNEYHRSLITILNFFKGDLVIILDEIDALKSVEYSDNIFAQIRSNYFSRTSYPVLERLTYALSGVIEPTELIKDKNKSPFNIGDKIYLDDFTKNEHDNFIEKSKLQISSSISDEIFKWTNGNPRLTFDICAEVENHLIHNGDVNIEILKSIITKKYLTSFDVAPIDHIRELAKSNKDIRKAVINIHKNKSFELSDEIKRKLYLYGIINSKFNEDTFIKNKIIELSLSEEWIKSLDREKEATFVRGLAVYTDKDFEAAIDIFNEVLSVSENINDIEGSNYFIGLCYSKLNNFEKAIKHFSYEFTDKSYIDDALALYGVCLMAIGDIRAINILEKAIEVESHTHAYHNALLNLAVNYNDKDKSLILFEKLYESTMISKTSEKEELNQLRALSLYYQAEIYNDKEEYLMAIKKIDLAIENSNTSDSIYLLYFKQIITENTNLETDSTLSKNLILNKILDNNLSISKTDNYPINFTENHIYEYLDYFFNLEDIDLFERLLEYSSEKLIQNKSKFDIVYNTSLISKTNRQSILNYILENFNEIDIDFKLIIFRDLSLINFREVNFENYFSKYLQAFKNVKSIVYEDIYLFAISIKLSSDNKNILHALQLCDTIIGRIENSEINKELKFDSVIIYYWYANLFFSNKESSQAIKYADFTLKLIKESDNLKTTLLDEAGLKYISEQLNKIKQSSLITRPILNFNKKIGRNEKIKVRYKNGEIKEDKFKKLEADILANRCIII